MWPTCIHTHLQREKGTDLPDQDEPARQLLISCFQVVEIHATGNLIPVIIRTIPSNLVRSATLMVASHQAAHLLVQ